MNDYFDRYGRLHEKPCINGEPSTNNGWIYSAYWKKLTRSNPTNPLVGNACCEEMERSPGKAVPPMSRDEILGLAYLGYLLPGHLEGWCFSPYKLPAFNLILFIKQLILLIKNKDDRNYFWRNNLDQIYFLAFSVPLTDRHFILKCWGKFNLLYFIIAKVDSLFNSTNRSSRAVAWLKYDKPISELKQYFIETHPINQFKG